MSSSIESISSLSDSGSLFRINTQSMQKRHDNLFSKIDSDSSGGIDKVEFSTLAKKLSEDTGNDLTADDVFTTYDSDGDGSLSSDELKAFMKDNAPPPPPPNGMGGPSGKNTSNMEDDLFAKLDTDEDELINKTEFSTFAEKISKNTGDTLDVDDVFTTYDADGDGSLSSDELKAFMKDNAPPPPPFQMQNARSAYGTDQETDQTTILQELLNKLSAGEGTESADITEAFKTFISKLLESLLDEGGSSLVNVIA
jgi:Ca2+-binding EF-hand superfamily protein